MYRIVAKRIVTPLVLSHLQEIVATTNPAIILLKLFLDITDIEYVFSIKKASFKKGAVLRVWISPLTLQGSVWGNVWRTERFYNISRVD